MGQLITTGVWYVKLGHETEFVDEWTRFTQHASTFAGATTLRLGRDLGDPSRYVSFAPWVDPDSAHEWKAQPDFGERIGRVLQHVDKFEPSELEVVAEVTAGATSSTS